MDIGSTSNHLWVCGNWKHLVLWCGWEPKWFLFDGNFPKKNVSKFKGPAWTKPKSWHLWKHIHLLGNISRGFLTPWSPRTLSAAVAVHGFRHLPGWPKRLPAMSCSKGGKQDRIQNKYVGTLLNPWHVLCLNHCQTTSDTYFQDRKVLATWLTHI